MCVIVRADAYPRSVLKVFVTIGYKRVDALLQIVRMITVVHQPLSVVDSHLDNHPGSLVVIVTVLLADAVSLADLIILDAAVVVVLSARMLLAVDVTLVKRSSIDKKDNEDDLLALDALVVKVLVRSVHTPIALVNRRRKIQHGANFT